MKKSMLVLIILAGFFPAVLAVAQYFENIRNEAEAKKDKIELQKKIDSLNIANTNLANQIRDLSTDNANLSHQLTKTSLLLSSNVIGSDYLDVIAFKSSDNQIKISLKNNSKFPAYDVQLVILDYEEIIKCDKTFGKESVYIDKKCYKKNISVVGTFNISPKSEIEIPNLLLIRGKYIHYAFQIQTRNGITLRQSIFKVNENKIEQSYRIYNFQEDRLTLIKESNPLNVSKEYWNQHFYSHPYVYMQGYD